MKASTPLSILIVDDNKDTAETFAQVMQFVGHKTQTAYSAADAASRVAEGFVPDAVLMDIGLPDLDGFALAKELNRALTRPPLLIAVTGHSGLDRRMREEGFEVYFVKPVDPELILSVLEGHAARLRRGTPA